MYKLFQTRMSRDAEASSALAAIQAVARPADLESATLDFKEDGRSVDDTLRDLAQASLCFANASGGVLVLGVADKLSGPPAFKGTRLDVVQLQKRIYDLSRPPLLVDIKEESRSGIRLLLVFVPQSFEIHSDPRDERPDELP
jgi:ATP-dependent DNA helicase RecG